MSNVICLVNPQNGSWVLFTILQNSLYQGSLYLGLSVPTTNVLDFKMTVFRNSSEKNSKKNFFNKKVICYSVVNKVILKKSISKS